MKVKLLVAIAVFVGLLLISISIRLYAQNQRLILDSSSKSTLYRQEINQAIESNNQRHQQEIELIRASERLSGVLQAFTSLYIEPQSSFPTWDFPKTAYQNRVFECFDQKAASTSSWLTNIAQNFSSENHIFVSCKSNQNIFVVTRDESNSLHLYLSVQEDSTLTKKSESTLPIIGDSQNLHAIKLLKWKTLPGKTRGEWVLFQIEETVDKNINTQWESYHTNKYVYEWLDVGSPHLIETCLESLPPLTNNRAQCTHVTSTNRPVYGQ